MAAKDILKGIAADVLAGKQRRAKVRSLLNYYGLKRRRESGMTAIRAELAAFGIETVPDFATAGFDDQVRFVPLGTSAAAIDTTVAPDPLPADYALEPESSPGARPRFLVLLRTYDAFDRFKRRLVRKRLATVLREGQNPRREDRDRFPFFVSVELPEDASEEHLETWAAEAAQLGKSEAEDTETGEPDPSPGPDAGVATGTPLFDLAAIREHSSALHEDLRGALAQEMAGLEQRLNRKVDEIRFEAVRSLAQELNSEEALKFIEEFEAETRDQLVKKDQVIADHLREIGLLQEQLAELEELAPDDEYDPSDAYPTMVYTVQLFQDLAQGSPIVVHDAALRTARRSASVRRREVLQFLLLLKDLAEGLYQRGGVGQPLKEWFQDRGHDYAQGDSQTTGTRFAADRTLNLDGSRIQLEEHVTLFPNTPNCVSVYFHRDEAARRLVVGYVGPHLRTVSR